MMSSYLLLSNFLTNGSVWNRMGTILKNLPFLRMFANGSGDPGSIPGHHTKD